MARSEYSLGTWVERNVNLGSEGAEKGFLWDVGPREERRAESVSDGVHRLPYPSISMAMQLLQHWGAPRGPWPLQRDAPRAGPGR